MQRLAFYTVIAVTLLLICGAATATDYRIDWSSISTGAGETSGGSYRVSSSIGQSTAGFVNTISLLHWIGFWSGDVPTPTAVPTTSAAKSLPNGVYVSVAGKIATSTETDYAGFFYVEEKNRTSGIRVAFPPGAVVGLTRGASVVNVIGTMDCTPEGERQVLASIIIIVSTTEDSLGPMAMANKWLGGIDLGVPPLGQYGVAKGSGLNNVGLLVRTFGRVSYVDSDYMLISDGSHSGPVRVDTSGLTSLPNQGDYICVTGISSLYKPGADRLPVILPSVDSDIWP